MRFLLDEMFAPSVAEALRQAGVDAVSVQEFPELRGLPDQTVFHVSQLAERALVTENVEDLIGEEDGWRQAGSEHHGLILTTNRQFPRHGRRSVGRVTRALVQLADERRDLTDRVWWLQPVDE